MNTYRLLIKQLSKSYGDLSVLNEVDLEFQSGQIYCLMGASGSGKTTLLRIVLGLERPDSGTVSLEPPAPLSAVFQEDRLCEEFSPLENIMLVTGKTYTRQQILSELSRLLPLESATRPVSTLSGGMKRRVAILRALLAPAPILLMDEPFTGLDEATRQIVIQYVKEKAVGKLVLITTHQEDDIPLLDGILITLPDND